MHTTCTHHTGTDLTSSAALPIRFGLCCLFTNENISFRTTTAKSLSTIPRTQQLVKLSDICLHNSRNLFQAIETCNRLGIGAFRISSPLFPRMTHPDVGYSLDHLQDSDEIQSLLESCRIYAKNKQVRLSFHPDQFVVLSSPHPSVVANSLRELEYHAQLAEAVGVDVINIHAGGVYGDKQAALHRFGEVCASLSERVRSRISLENDDVSYTPEDLLPVCEKYSIPFVYDVHHHRCNPDHLTVEAATEWAETTWKAIGQEQFSHLSSPRSGWQGLTLRPHADYINPDDFPACWLERKMTVDIEAKAKELAVLRLMENIQGRMQQG